MWKTNSDGRRPSCPKNSGPGKMDQDEPAVLVSDSWLDRDLYLDLSYLEREPKAGTEVTGLPVDPEPVEL